jgi:hypothetical protein
VGPVVKTHDNYLKNHKAVVRKGIEPRPGKREKAVVGGKTAEDIAEEAGILPGQRPRGRSNRLSLRSRFLLRRGYVSGSVTPRLLKVWLS